MGPTVYPIGFVTPKKLDKINLVIPLNVLDPAADRQYGDFGIHT